MPTNYTYCELTQIAEVVIKTIVYICVRLSLYRCHSECWQSGHEGGMTPFFTSLTVEQLTWETRRQQMMMCFIRGPC